MAEAMARGKEDGRAAPLSSPPGRAPGWRRLGRFLLDALLPPQCLGCRELLRTDVALCPACWATIRFIAPPLCEGCGLPFPTPAEAGMLCGGCLGRRRLFERARAAVVYDEASSRLILAFKRADRTDAAPVFGRWMARAGAELLADAALLVPVPMHWTRLLARKYNQAALLALAVGRESGVAVAPDLLRRSRRTPSLGTLGPKARAEAVRGAISVHPGRAAALKDRRVVLVDDVHTTSATAEACTAALLQAGAGAVDLLTLARTVRGG
jgi:predicted amidophosphoribosyltransferase